MRERSILTLLVLTVLTTIYVTCMITTGDRWIIT